MPTGCPISRVLCEKWKEWQPFFGVKSRKNKGWASPHFSSGVNNLGHGDICVTHVVPHNLRPCASATSSWMVRKLRTSPLSLESAGSETRQMVAANIRGQIGFRVRTCEICHRPADPFVYRG